MNRVIQLSADETAHYVSTVPGYRHISPIQECPLKKLVDGTSCRSCLAPFGKGRPEPNKKPRNLLRGLCFIDVVIKFNE